MTKEDVSVPVRKELLERLEGVSKASGIPMEELIDKALDLYLEHNRPDKH